MNPIQLIQQELNVYKKALKLSNEKFVEGKINAKLHETHISNLEPKIAKYTEALRILQTYMGE